MASVYILYSSKLKKFYTGSCKNLEERLTEHRDKIYNDAFTNRSNDWELYYHIDELGYNQARAIERHIKKMKSSIYIKNLKLYPKLVYNLRQRYE